MRPRRLESSAYGLTTLAADHAQGSMGISCSGVKSFFTVACAFRYHSTALGNVEQRVQNFRPPNALPAQQAYPCSALLSGTAARSDAQSKISQTLRAYQCYLPFPNSGDGHLGIYLEHNTWRVSSRLLAGPVQ
ncbi:hypothetical protein SS50377_20646 [Spironucleus salmonicida]|nr:hypothetical protein SS50377_20646 [Spironucleus salmonicida]|eukprot:EST48181.1 Hypothetical protein SS50377_11663 [Spironucleus salmonicida]